MIDILRATKESLLPGKTILVIGSSGMVGSRFLEDFGANFITPDNVELDITNCEAVREYIGKNHPDVVINFAAFTDVNAAERQRDDRTGSCWQINVEGVRNLLDAIDSQRTHFIHISTDMVFSGSQDDPGPYTENHPPEDDPSKLTWYGYTKMEAERLIQERLGGEGTVIRIIYPVRAEYAVKPDYLRGPLAKFDSGATLTMFTDQTISMTSIDEVGVALGRIVNGGLKGIFHVSSRDTGTPHEIISYLLLKARGRGEVKESSLAELVWAGKIKSYRYGQRGGLDVSQTEEKLGMQFSTWREIVDILATVWAK